MRIEIPKAYAFLFSPSRHKVVHGGRGKAASWSFARAAIVRAATVPTRFLCCREIQQSIKESVHMLLKDQIERMGIPGFQISETSITHQNGSRFIFEGLFRNVNRIKSMEGINICWVAEAESVSDDSWELLTPTIRADDSEIWIEFNPQFEDDATYRRWVLNPPPDSVVREINYDQNPYFPDVLKAEMEFDKSRDKALYEWKWLGKPKGAGRRVWPSFDKEFHVREFDAERIRAGNCYMAMDPHSKYYPFCVWVAVIPKNERGRPEDFYRHVYAEWPTYDDLGGFYHDMRHKVQYRESILGLSDILKGKDVYGRILARFIDPRFAKGAGGWNWSTSTEGVVEQFRKRENGGLIFQMPEIIDLDVQHSVIQSDMVFNRDRPISWDNDPTFSVSPACKNLITSLSNHRLIEGGEKEEEKYKDASDALRICYAGFAGKAFEGMPKAKPVNMAAFDAVDYGWRKHTVKKSPQRTPAWREI